MTQMPDADPNLVDPITDDPFSLSNTKRSTEFMADANAEITATASALRQRTSKDILTPDSFASATAALASRANAAVIIPPSYVGAVPDVGTAKTIVDLRPATAHISRLGGKRHIREFAPDETGVADSSAAFVAAFAAMTAGGTLVLAPRATYSISSSIVLNGVSNLRIEGNGATITQRTGWTQTNPMVNLAGSHHIEFADLKLLGIATTASTGAGFLFDNSYNVTLRRCSVTSVSGSGVSLVADTAAHDFFLYEFTATSCKTHGISFKAGSYIRVNSFIVTGCGVNGVDLEPTTTSPSYVELRKGVIGSLPGYGVQGNAIYTTMDDMTITACTAGSVNMGGGFTNRYSNLYADGSIRLIGGNVIGNMIRGTSFEVAGPLGRFDGVHIASHLLRTPGAYVNNDPTVVVTGLQIRGTETTIISGSAAGFGSVSGPYQAVDLAVWRSWFPNLFKGTAYSDVWVPGGMNHHGDPVFGVKSLSGTSTKGQNLRGVAVPITSNLPAGSAYSVAFPSMAGRQFTSFSLGASTRTTQIASDTFDRANSTTSLGTSSGGQTWQVLSGTWGITSNKAYKVDTVVNNEFAVIDSGIKSADVSCDVAFDGSGVAGLVIGMVDEQNCLLFSTGAPTNAQIYKRDAGTWTSLAVAVVANYANTTKTLRMTFNATTGVVTGYLGGTQVVTYTLSAPELAKYGAGTKQGLRGYSNSGTAVTFDNYVVTTFPAQVPPTAGTWYVRVGARRRDSGPTAWLPQQSVIVAPGQNSVTMTMTDWWLSTLGTEYIEGLTWVRGTTSGGPYTYRGDGLLLNAPFTPGMSGTAAQVVDGGRLGAAYVDGGLSIVGQTGSFTCVDESGWEPDASYAVEATASWPTTVYCTAKRRDGFDLKFGTQAPAAGTVDWMIVR